MGYLDNTGLSRIWAKIKSALSYKIDDIEIEGGYLYGLCDGVRIVGPVPIGIYEMTLTNTSGWDSKTIVSGDECTISFEWSYLEYNVVTGTGTLDVYLNNSLLSSTTISQGSETVDVHSSLITGGNTVMITVTNSRGTSKSLLFEITVAEKVGAIYGVEWDYSQNSSVLTRIDDASEFSSPTPATSTSEVGLSPFDSIAPWSGMKMYNVLSDGTIISQDDANFSYSNDTMVYIPEFYYKVEKDTVNSKHRWRISSTEQTGFTRHPGSGKYVGRYHTSGTKNSVNSVADLSSVTGQTPILCVNIPAWREGSEVKGDGWRMLDVATWSAVQMLYLVEYADLKSQTPLGSGYTMKELGTEGGTDNALYHTIKATDSHNSYRYIEDPFSNAWNTVDGIITVDRQALISTNPDSYADYNSGYTATGAYLPTTGWTSEFANTSTCDFCFIPCSSVKGSDSSADYSSNYTWSNTDRRIVMYGGYTIRYPQFQMFTLWALNYVTAACEQASSRLIYDSSTI